MQLPGTPEVAGREQQPMHTVTRGFPYSCQQPPAIRSGVPQDRVYVVPFNQNCVESPIERKVICSVQRNAMRGTRFGYHVHLSPITKHIRKGEMVFCLETWPKREGPSIICQLRAGDS